MKLPLLLFASIAAVIPALAAETSPAPMKGSLYHVVSLKFKPTATKEQVRQIEQEFRALKTKIPAVASLTWGTNVSPEKLDKGFTHCFILTFASEKDRDAYLVHPDHKAFVEILKPAMEDAFVVDFWGM